MVSEYFLAETLAGWGLVGRVLAPKVLAPKVLALKVLALKVLAPKVLAPKAVAPMLVALIDWWPSGGAYVSPCHANRSFASFGCGNYGRTTRPGTMAFDAVGPSLALGSVERKPMGFVTLLPSPP